MTRALTLLPATLLALALAAPAKAQDRPFRVAFVDLQQALNGVEDGRRAIAQIESFAKTKEAEFVKKKAQVLEMTKKLELERNMLTPEEFERKERELALIHLEYQQFGQQAQEELAQMEQVLKGKILEKLSATAQKIAKERGFDFVLEAGSAVYFKETLDLTPAVISAYDAGR